MAKTGRERQNPKTKLPQLRKPPSIPTGGRMYKPLPRAQQPIVQGPGDPPPGFIRASTSITEWYVWYALCKIFDPLVDPRTGPFEGRYPYFSYQTPFGGSGPGGATIDFVVYAIGTGRLDTALRVVTEFWHIFTSNDKQASDAFQRDTIESSGMTVIDLYDQDILGDPSGAKCIVTVKNALGMIERPDPILTGTALRATRMSPIG
jgi:hypothetical protein